MSGASHINGNNKAFSMVEVMVALSILAFAGAGMGLLLRNVGSAQRDLDRLAQSEILRRTLRTQFNCRKSLNIDINAPLPQGNECQKSAAGKTLFIFGKDGTELFQMHTSGEYYRVADWHVRARCSGESVVLEGRLNVRTRTQNSPDAKFGEWRDIFNGTSRFCYDYLSPTASSCSNSYPLKVGFDSGGAVCCRAVRVQANGEAVAKCSPFEVLTQGGGYCAATQMRRREVPKLRMNGIAIGKTKSTRTTIAPPFVPHFFFPTADMIGDIIGPWENVDVPRGGILVKNSPRENSLGVLERWETICRADDSLEDFPAVADAVCCPRRW